jgi:hypothetical protein
MAAEIFVELKKQGFNAELVTEYVKKWAWMGIGVNNWADSLYIFAKQFRYESIHYGKVEYLVTDSPISLPVAYEHLYDAGGPAPIKALYETLRARQKAEGVVQNIDFHLLRQHGYKAEGRFESDEQAAIKVDQAIRQLIPAHPVRNANEVLEVLAHHRRMG